MVKGEVIDEDEILSWNPWRQRENVFIKNNISGNIDTTSGGV
jgi:hypothetical protein